MTYKDVRDIRSGCLQEAFDNTPIMEELSDMIDKAIEKQIPKKPNDTQIEGPYSAEFDYGCPNCGIWFTKEWNYCPCCGQALDWGEES